jgi:lysyl-tRNA synthetase class I
VPDFDENLRAALEHDETFQSIMAQLKEAASSTVTVRDDTPCLKPGCGCKHIRTVKVPDYKLKLQIIEFLANRGVGRPQQAEAESGERITFIREVRK